MPVFKIVVTERVLREASVLVEAPSEDAAEEYARSPGAVLGGDLVFREVETETWDVEVEFSPGEPDIFVDWDGNKTKPES